MNIETYQLFISISTVITLIMVSLVPVTALAMSRLPLDAATRSADSPEGTACELPPNIENIQGNAAAGYPLLDKKETGNSATATFALG